MPILEEHTWTTHFDLPLGARFDDGSVFVNESDLHARQGYPDVSGASLASHKPTVTLPAMQTRFDKGSVV